MVESRILFRVLLSMPTNRFILQLKLLLLPHIYIQNCGSLKCNCITYMRFMMCLPLIFYDIMRHKPIIRYDIKINLRMTCKKPGPNVCRQTYVKQMHGRSTVFENVISVNYSRYIRSLR